MADVFHRSLFLAGPQGRLEALLWTSPTAEPPLAAVVCHPHPLFGGTMHNKVVFQTAKALHQFGIPVLRFNFRGVGLSEGVHDEGRGEQEDVRASLDYLATEFPGRPILVAGFSFGSAVGLLVGCEDARVAESIGLGLPVNNSDFGFLHACPKPKLIVQGGSDKFGSRKNIESVFATMSEPKRLVIVEGADHFFTGQLEKVGAAIGDWLAERHPRNAAANGPANS
jgi:alpha/beta superfamily hydrolase